MTKDEKWALLKAGVVINKLNYGGVTNVLLLPQFLLKFDMETFPNMKTFHEIYHATAPNTTVLTYHGKYIGLRLMDYSSNKKDSLSFSCNHPATDYWRSILQPIWDEQNKNICMTCHGTGWDGETYTLTCMDCGGNGKQ